MIHLNSLSEGLGIGEYKEKSQHVTVPKNTNDKKEGRHRKDLSDIGFIFILFYTCQANSSLKL